MGPCRWRPRTKGGKNIPLTFPFWAGKEEAWAEEDRWCYWQVDYENPQTPSLEQGEKTSP